MTTEKEVLIISSIAKAKNKNFIQLVERFALNESCPDIKAFQRDGATAIIDLAVEFEKLSYSCNQESLARALGGLSDIQVRDFALGSHTADNFQIYLQMWRYLLQIAPDGFISPVACLFATLAYEMGDTPLAFRALERASSDQPNYSLTILLRRVFGSGWPAAAFAAMRTELHPKVTAGIFD